MRQHKNNILPEMFDVRPMTKRGGVDWNLVDQVRHSSGQPVSLSESSGDPVSPPVFFSGEEPSQVLPATPAVSYEWEPDYSFHSIPSIEEKKGGNVSHVAGPVKWIGLLLFIVTVCIAGREMLSMKGRVLGESETGYRNLSSAVASLQTGDAQESGQDFETAYAAFSSAWEHLGMWRFDGADVLQYIPFLSQVSSGKNIISAGRHIARAGGLLNDSFAALSLSGNPLSKQNGSFLDILDTIGKPLAQALPELTAARDALGEVPLDDIPEEKRATFEKARKSLPIVISAGEAFLEQRGLLTDVLGGNGPRKYLFLFQNNHELRPTGGFIGSYGLLDMKDGKIRKFFVDGIFNPDGQLKEKIIPPTPLQKVSVAWSLHDSNWSPDFPTAARKAASLYEKTGGASVDGVIALTPDIIRDLVGIFGPIEMKEYGVTLDKNNFVETVQEEVEVKYDREENQPKKILSDLAPILLDRIFSTRDPKKLLSVLEVLTDQLNRRNILLYAKDSEVESNIETLGWSGKLEETPLDYLSVINTNINGYKTDAVVKESINHTAQVRSDGSVVDTVRITRRHEGGQTRYEWWNKVNADYMRVFVPLGSELLSVHGQTREVVTPPVDYSALGFTPDADIAKEEGSIVIDGESGTRIGEDLGKTTFGNWVYVSPGEQATIEYEYRLPFRVTEADYASYSILFQKQSGSFGSAVQSTIDFPDAYQLEWQTGEYQRKNTILRFESTLEKNLFLGAVWQTAPDGEHEK